MTRDKLMELAARVEEATAEEERELIQASYEALRPAEMCWPDRLYDMGGALSITESLVPEGPRRLIEQQTFKSGAPDEPERSWARVSVMAEPLLEARGEARAATPALALLAACLRAIAKDETK
jgi:hypothetical protein